MIIIFTNYIYSSKTIVVFGSLACVYDLFIAKLKRLTLTRDYSPSARCTEVEVDLGPSYTAMVYYREISGVETGLGYAAFPTAAFETAADLRRCCYSGFPWRRDHQNTTLPADTCSTEKSVDPVPMVNSGLRSADTTQEYVVWGTRSLKPTIFKRYKIISRFFCFIMLYYYINYIYLFSHIRMSLDYIFKNMNLKSGTRKICHTNRLDLIFYNKFKKILEVLS